MVKKILKNTLWSMIPIGLGILFMSFLWNKVEIIVSKERSTERSAFIQKIQATVGMAGNKVENTVAATFKFDNITYPPQPEYSIDPEAAPPKLGAVAFVVGDVETGDIILEKNADSVFPIASVTKLMTALVSLETHDQHETTKVSSRAANTLSSRGGLRQGEEVLISDLLYPLLLVSSNDAAEVLAEHDGRGKFMQSMNDFAATIGMEKTSFDDPSGLSSGNTSTAKDLFRMSTYLENHHRVVFDITALTEYTALGKVWNNINMFSKNSNFLGGKTGYTDRAKRTGVGIFSVSFPGYEDRHIGIVLLRTDDRTKDIYTILNYLREHVSYGYAEELKEAEPDEIIQQGGEVAGEMTENENLALLRRREDPVVVNSCPKPETDFDDLSLFNISQVSAAPDNFTPENLIPIKKLVNTKGKDICLSEEAAMALNTMYEDMREAGLSLSVTSGFRSYETQQIIFRDWHQQNTVKDGEEAVAKPGHSEHQLGTTVDFTSPAVGYASAHRGFHLTDEYAWLDKNAHRYGFILSYPPKKKTGYIFEPWHWRYVGIENAYHIKASNRTIQEFLDPQAAKEEADKQVKGEVTLSFLGDIMMDRGVKTSIYSNHGGDYNKLFQNLSELASADIAFANLEGPISDVGNNVGSKYSFRMEEKTLEALSGASFDIVSFANNHVGDWNMAAFKDTLDNLEHAGIKVSGAGNNISEASEPDIFVVNGVKIGFLAFTDVGPDWMKASDTAAGILLAKDEKRLDYIKNAKASTDVLVVSYHWGDEYVPYNTRQQSLAESSIDAGADIVVGHHPHVMQDTVRYKDGLIMYSLGNAIFDQYFSEETMQGSLVTAVVTKDGLKSYEEKVFTLDATYVPGVPVRK